MNKKYPYNLLSKVFWDESFTVPLNEDQKAGLEYVIASLNERAQYVVLHKYVSEEKLSMNEISLQLGTSKQAVASVERKIIMKIRQPQNAILIQYGLNGATKIKDDLLEHAGISYRTYNALSNGGIKKLSDIRSMRQLDSIRNIGEKGKIEILQKLKERGIVLAEGRGKT